MKTLKEMIKESLPRTKQDIIDGILDCLLLTAIVILISIVG